MKRHKRLVKNVMEEFTFLYQNTNSIQYYGKCQELPNYGSSIHFNSISLTKKKKTV